MKRDSCLHGLEACLLHKPLAGHPGSGNHLHFSLQKQARASVDGFHLSSALPSTALHTWSIVHPADCCVAAQLALTAPPAGTGLNATRVFDASLMTLEASASVLVPEKRDSYERRTDWNFQQLVEDMP